MELWVPHSGLPYHKYETGGVNKQVSVGATGLLILPVVVHQPFSFESNGHILLAYHPHF